MELILSRQYWLWIRVLGAVMVCQVLYPIRHLAPLPYAEASEVHLDAIATWLASY